MTSSSVTPVLPTSEFFFVGAVVTRNDEIGKWVVLSTNARTVRIAKLGGDNGRYWRVPASSLTKSSAV